QNLRDVYLDIIGKYEVSNHQSGNGDRKSRCDLFMVSTLCQTKFIKPYSILPHKINQDPSKTVYFILMKPITIPQNMYNSNETDVSLTKQNFMLYPLNICKNIF
ncbi:unnamed protein product, partial [Owenia fusiformis]